MANNKPESGSFRPGHRAVAVRITLILVFGTLLTAIGFGIARTLESQRIEREFEAGASDRVMAVQRALDSQRLLLEALAAFLASVEGIDRDRFRSFVSPLLSPGSPMQAISWAPVVSLAERAAMEDAARTEGMSAFRITERDRTGALVPAASRDLYTPVLYILPVAGNEAAIGFDLSSEPNRRAALDAARDSGEISTTRRLRLVQDRRSRVGFLSAIAVYRPGERPATAAARRAALAGYATQVFWVDQLIEMGLASLQPGGIDLFFYDPADGENADPVYVHTSRIRGPEERLSSVAPAANESLSHLGRLQVGGREWLVVSVPAPGFLAARRGPLTWVLLGMGLLATLVGAGYAGADEGHRRRLQAAHTQLEHSEARLRQVLERMPALLIAFDEDRVVALWNQECERVTGYAADEIVGNPNAAELIYPDPEHLRSVRAEADARGRTYRDWEVTLTARDGTPRVVSWSNISAGIPIPGWASWEIGIDVTERKRAARERQEMQEQLLQSQKLESLGLLAGGISHDFNNLLTAILGNASLALEALPAKGPARVALEAVVLASQRASLLTQQLLAYAGKGSFETRPIDLSEHVREIGSLLQAAVPKKISLRFDLGSDLPAVLVDPSQMQQLVMNLVINGAEACGDEPGTVMVRTDIREVDEHYAKSLQPQGGLEPGTYLCLEVQDDGRGMDEATQARVFDPFFSTKFTGRGLGLSAALGIVRSHSGCILVYSTPGEGSVFKVLLPACDEAPDRETPAPAEGLGGSGVILVVDDEPMICKLAVRVLTDLGYHVLTAADGEEAIEVFRKKSAEIDCVLLDMTMPRMDGAETYEAIRRMRPDVTAILSSGYNEVAATQRFVGRGLAGFLQKPYSARDLGKKVQEVLRSRSTS